MTRPFVSAALVVAPAAGLTSARPRVEFQLREVGTDTCRALVEDPTAVRPFPLARLVVSGLGSFLLVVTCGLVLLTTAPRGFGYAPVVVTSGSMQPTIDVGDVVVTAPSAGDALGVGAVVNYSVDGGTRLHRIVEVTPAGYRTAGDANAQADSDLVQPAQVRGVGAVVVPFIGLPRVWADRGQWPWLVLTAVGLVASLYVSRSRWVERDPFRWS